MQSPLFGRRRADRLLVVAGIALLCMAAILYFVVPEGRVVFEVMRKPTFSKRDVVAMGLAIVGLASLLSRSHMTAARHVIGIGFVGASLFWLLEPHPFQGPVIATNGRHGIHENDWLALFPALIGLIFLVPRPRRRVPLGPDRDAQ
jgi:hypothetical protein